MSASGHIYAWCKVSLPHGYRRAGKAVFFYKPDGFSFKYFMSMFFFLSLLDTA
jgi:hypothetical protein